MIRKKIEMLALAAMLSISMATTALPLTALADDGGEQTEEETNIFQEGKYSVPASLMKADDITQASMAASCIAGNATLTIGADATWTVTVPITSVTVYGHTAYASDFKVYPGSDTTAEATATAYTEDANGNVNSITFTFTDHTLDGVYLSMNTGMGTSNAFLALDFDHATIDTTDLQTTISQAEALTEADYTIASWSALKEALTAAQAQVASPTSAKDCTEAETALNAAMEALVEQTGIGSENVTLEAGKYTVPASLMNASDITKASMAASCIAGDATLTVAEDGTMTATVPITAVTVYGVTAYASDFKVYAGALGTDTTATEFTTDADGNVDSITFTIPNKAMDGAYLNMVAMAGRTVDAFLKLDYASAKEIVSTDALTAAIKAAKALDSSKYTAETWKAVNTALTAANKALTAESQKAVDAATTALNNAVKALKENTAKEVVTPTPAVAKLAITKGKTYTVSGRKYKVTKAAKTGSTVTFMGITNAKATSVTVPTTVKIKGLTCKVTAIYKKALKNKKKLKTVTIGKNVTSIGTYAFYGCKNLKKITVKSTKIKSVGKKSLSGIYKKAVIKVPKSKLKTYKKLFKGKGQKKTVTIKK